MSVRADSVTRTFNRKALLIAAAIAAAVGISPLAHADTVSWLNTATTTNWTTAANWATDPGHTPPLATDIAAFSSATAYAKLPNVDVSSTVDSILDNGAATLTLSATAGQSLTIAPASSTNGITLSAGAGAATVSSALILGANQTWTDSAATGLTIGTGTTTGGGFNLTVTNNGTSTAALTVSGASSGLGNLTINNSNSGTGTVSMSAAMAGTGILTVNDTSASTTTANITLSGPISGFASASFSNAATGAANTAAVLISGNITNASTLNFSNTNANTGTLSSTGILNGSGSLTLNSTGSKAVTATGAITGYTTLNASATGAGTLTESGVILGSGAGTFTINANGLATVSGAINAWANLNINNSGATAGTATVSSLIAGGGGLAGVTNLSISNSNSGTGALTVSGTIVGTGALSVSNSTLNATTLSTQVNGFSSVSVSAGVGDTVTFTAGYAKNFTGTTTITGGGTLFLTTTASPGGTGAFLVTNGTLKAGGTANTLTTLGVITLGGAGTNGVLDLGGFSEQIGGLADGASAGGTETIGSASAGGNTSILTVNTGPGSSTFGGVIQNVLGTNNGQVVGITKAGLNTLSLTGLNTYTAATSGNQGTLEFVGQSTGVTQTLGLLSVTSGGLILQSTYGSSGTSVLAFTNTTFTHTAGATIDFVISGGTATTNEIKLGTSAVSAFIGPWATYGTGTSTQYATIITGSLVGNYTAGTAAADATFLNAAGTNFELASGGTLTASGAANTIRYGGSAQAIATNGNTLSLNGVLNAGSGALSFTNTGVGGVTVGSTNELVLNAASADIEFASPFALNSTTSQSLTIAGVNKVIFDTSITNSNTGTLTINNGAAGVGGLVIGASKSLILQANSGSIVVNSPIVDSAAGASAVTIQSTGALIVRLAGANTFTGGVTVTSGSTIDLTNASNGAAMGSGTFTLQQGSTLGNSSTGTFTNTLNNAQVWAGDLTISGASGSSGIVLGSFTLGAIILAPGSGNPSGAHTLTLTDNNTSTVTLGAIGDGSYNVGLTKSGAAGSLALNGFNTFSGPLTVNAGSVTVGTVYALNPVNPLVLNAGATFALNSQTIFFAGLNDAAGGGGGISTSTSGRAFTLLGSDSFNTNTAFNNTYAFSGIIGTGNPGNISLIKGGTFTQYLTGKSVYTGSTTINSGSLILDFSGASTANEVAGATPITNILYNGIVAGDPLGLGGGTLGLVGGSTASTSYSQSFSTIAISMGSSTVQLTANGGDPLLLNLTGALSRAAGGTVNFILPSGTPGATNGIRTIALTTNGILGGYAVVGGADWAVTGATAGTYNISAYSAYTSFIGAASVAASNYQISPAVSAGTGTDIVTANETFNSLKITPSAASQTLTINAAVSLTLTTPGGLLFTGSNDYTIAGVNATTSKLAATELVVQQYAANNNLTIGAVISGSTLTKAGPGMLTLTNTNTISGTVYLNSGVTNVNTLGALGTGTVLNFNGGTLQYASPAAASPFTGTTDITMSGANARQINIGYAGATIDTNGNTVTLANANSLMGSPSGYFGGLTKTGAGTLILSNAVSYYGPTVISGGTLSIGTGTLAPVAPITMVGGISTSGGSITGLTSVSGIFVGEIVTGSSIALGQIVTAVNAANNSVTTNSAQAGTGLGTVTFGGFTPLNNGGPGASSSIGLSSPAAQNLVLDGGTLQYTGPATSTNRLFTVTANSGTIDASGTGLVAFSSPGTLVFNGSGNRTLTLRGTNTGNNTLTPVITNPTSGTTALVKNDAGTWVLAGNDTYTGTTTLMGGTLKLVAAANNINASSDIIVGDSLADASAILDVTGVSGGFTLGGSQTLSGHGTVVGNVATSANSILAPGNSLGTTHYTGDLSLAPGTILDYDFAAPGTSDLSAITGTLALPTGAGSVTLNLNDIGGLAEGTYQLFTFTNSLVGGAPSLGDTFSIGTTPLVGETYTFTNPGNEIDLTIGTPGVPEPASLALLGLGAAGLLLRRRRSPIS